MIEISFGKLVLLALIALVVLGPEKLPHAARTAGALLRRVRGGWDSVRAEVERELQIEDIRRAAREAAAKAEAAQAELDATLRRAREPFAQTAAEVRGHADSAGEALRQSVTSPPARIDAAPSQATPSSAPEPAQPAAAHEAAAAATPAQQAPDSIGAHPPSSKEAPHGGA